MLKTENLFIPMRRLTNHETKRHIRYLPPKGEDAGDAPKAGVEFPKAGDEEAPKVWVEPNGEEA